jgi:hypothetical protein
VEGRWRARHGCEPAQLRRCMPALCVVKTTLLKPSCLSSAPVSVYILVATRCTPAALCSAPPIAARSSTAGGPTLQGQGSLPHHCGLHLGTAGCNGGAESLQPGAHARGQMRLQGSLGSGCTTHKAQLGICCAVPPPLQPLLPSLHAMRCAVWCASYLPRPLLLLLPAAADQPVQPRRPAAVHPGLQPGS